MTAPTHICFGVLFAALTGTSGVNSIACALGALLPDIDHPQSSIGKVFFFLSIPINQKFGHRGVIHGFVVWLPILIVGLLANSQILTFIGLGAISHILIDSYTISGVKALLPFSEKSMVFLRRDWRIYTGSVHEIILFCAMFGLISVMNYSHALGGPRKLINLLARSPKITVEEFNRAGLKYCQAKGHFRWSDGEIEDVFWPVVGLEGGKMVFWCEEKLQLIREGKQGKFLKSVLVQNEYIWPIVRVKGGYCKVSSPAFWFDGKKWHFAKEGDIAFGTIKEIKGGMPEIDLVEPKIYF